MGTGFSTGDLGMALALGAVLFLVAFRLGAVFLRTVFLRAGLRLKAAIRRAGFFLRAGFRETFRAAALFLPRLATFFRFARFFAKPLPPFLKMPKLRRLQSTERTGL